MEKGQSLSEGRSSVLVFNHLKRKERSAEEASTEGASAPSSFPPITTISTGRGSDQYDVFLSFRGSDTRKGFTDHLYRSLVNAGTVPISVFRDDDSLEIGEDFDSEILDAITRSKISIPIISENFASSIWCLRELVRIMDCKKSMSHIVLPIFYKVEPSDVRYLKGNFGEAFRLREKRFGEKDIQEGKQALTEVSYLKGWESEKFADGHEGELVEEVIKTIFSKLRHHFQLDVTKDLVGVDDHVQKIRNWVNARTSHTQMIGIYGMGGIGKTTLAKVIYNELSSNFVHRAFLPDIRETARQKGIPHLQNQLINKIQPNEPKVSTSDDGISLIKSRFNGKKVLIILDDIDDQDQLNALARERDWFMTGSIIIVTTRYKAVLDQSKFEVDYLYELEGLDEVNSLLLFQRHAFRMDHSLMDFEVISHDIVSTTGRLPLALTVIGSYLYGKTNRGVWEDVLEKLRKEPHGDVQSKLKISYDALELGHKEIFLDIACFGIGEQSTIAMYMWKDCGFSPNQGIEELKLRCLIRIGDEGKLMMHDQLRDLGRSIVCHEGPLERRSRLWDFKEAWRVLEQRKGTEMIQAICLDHHHHNETCANELFKNLQSLRFLRLQCKKFSGDFDKLFIELRWLQWFGCGTSFSFLWTFLATNLHLPKLVVLQLSRADITEDWTGWSSMMTAKRLKVLDLAYCMNLRCTPDLSAFRKLDILILRGCAKLEQVHPSIGKIQTLVSLDLSGCKSLKEIPTSIGKIQTLVSLDVGGCGSLKEIPTSIGFLRKLEKLSASGCWSLKEIPNSIGDLENLQHLDLDFTRIEELPNSIGRLKKLRILILRNCFKLEQVHPSIGKIQTLVSLDLSGCDILKEIPTSIGFLRKLEKLNASNCWSLKQIPSSIGDLENLQHLDLGFTAIEELPNSIGRLKKLQILIMRGCFKLEQVHPSIGKIQTLVSLDLSGCDILKEIPTSIGFLRKLEKFNASNCWSLKQIPSSIGDLENLQHLDLGFSAIEELPNSIGRLKKLQILILRGCFKLEQVHPSIGKIHTLVSLDLSGCDRLKEIPTSIGFLRKLEKLSVSHCWSLKEIPSSIGDLENLQHLDLNFIRIEELPNSIGRLKKLRIPSCRDPIFEAVGSRASGLSRDYDSNWVFGASSPRPIPNGGVVFYQFSNLV